MNHYHYSVSGTVFARELLNETDPNGGCEKACYECLLSFYNQPAPTQRLEQLRALCQSDLERQVLQGILDACLPLPDSAQETIYEPCGGPLTIADFFYNPKIVVFVDGSSQHQDYVRVADERKRWKRLGLGSRVVVIDGNNIEKGLQYLRSRLAGQ